MEEELDKDMKPKLIGETYMRKATERGFGARPNRRCFDCDKIIEDE